jgi:hypothetical protein
LIDSDATLLYAIAISMYGARRPIQMGNEWRVARTYFSSLEGVLRDTEKQGFSIVLIAQLDPAKTKQQFEVVLIGKRTSGVCPAVSEGLTISPQYGSFTSDRESVYLDP